LLDIGLSTGVERVKYVDRRRVGENLVDEVLLFGIARGYGCFRKDFFEFWNLECFSFGIMSEKI
jgi:hypothetical protein